MTTRTAGTAAPVDTSLLDGELLRRRRQELGVSERELARRIGVSDAFIFSTERGSNHPDIPVGLLAELMSHLGLTPAEVFRAAT